MLTAPGAGRSNKIFSRFGTLEWSAGRNAPRRSTPSTGGRACRLCGRLPAADGRQTVGIRCGHSIARLLPTTATEAPICCGRRHGRSTAPRTDTRGRGERRAGRQTDRNWRSFGTDRVARPRIELRHLDRGTLGQIPPSDDRSPGSQPLRRLEPRRAGDRLSRIRPTRPKPGALCWRIATAPTVGRSPVSIPCASVGRRTGLACS